jgi:hypothetical protein
MLDRQERTALALADERQEGVEQALVEDRVDGRVDGVAVPLEGVRQATWPVHTLGEQHAQPGVGEQRRGRRAAGAATDHDNVVVVPLYLGHSLTSVVENMRDQPMMRRSVITPLATSATYRSVMIRVPIVIHANSM